MKRIILAAIAVVAIAIVAVAAFAYLNVGTGSLQLLVTDPPDWGNATQVYINYSAVEVHRADAGNSSGWFTATNTSGWLNLTEIISANQTIGSANLQVGKYNLIRFSIDQAIVTINGENSTATVPSGQLQVAITQSGVTVEAGQTSQLLIQLNTKVETSAANIQIVPDVRAVPV